MLRVRVNGGVVLAVTLASALLFGSCEQALDSDANTIVADSAGIRVVVSVGSRTYREVSEKPMLSIGSGNAATPRTELGYVADGLILSPLRVAIADYLASSVLLFDSLGAHLSTWGSPGQGPGEFGAIANVDRFRGDSVLVGEIGSRRLSVLNATGSFGRTITPRLRPEVPPGYTPVVSCCQSWGAEIGSGTLLMTFPELVPTSGPGRRRSLVQLLTMSPRGDDARHTASFRGGDYRMDLEGAASPRPEHYPRGVSIAPREGGFAVTDGISYEVRFHATDGTVLTIARLERQRVPFRRAMRGATEEYLDRLEARVGAPEASGFNQLRDQPYPDSLPAYTLLLTDDSGNAWAGSLHAARLGQQPRFDVFAPDGRFLGQVLLPFDGRVLDVWQGHLLAVVRDELDVQSVVMYETSEPVRE